MMARGPKTFEVFEHVRTGNWHVKGAPEVDHSITVIHRNSMEPIMERFQDKTVLITGGTSGIGLAAAKAFAEEGARVVVTGRDAAALEKAQAELGPKAIAIRNDAGAPS